MHTSFAIRNATKIDASGMLPHFWMVVDGGKIAAVGTSDGDFDAAARRAGIVDSSAAVGAGAGAGSDTGTVIDASAVINATGRYLVPGYIDMHSHGAAGGDFDTSTNTIIAGRNYHLQHGTTRQLASLITNPLDVMETNIRRVASVMESRPDILGMHLEGPFLSPLHKGAHDPACLKDPTDDVVDRLLDAAPGAIRQITIAPELPHGMSGIAHMAARGVIPAVGHCDADYAQARSAFQAGAGILTHIYNAMNGIHHRAPGPIPAAVENPNVTVELINDGFHVQDPAVRIAFDLAPHRIAFVTDSMAATGCPDGPYKLGNLDVQVVDGHARLVSNGAIAGSTLTLETAVQRAITEVGISPVAAVEAATHVPAATLGFGERFGMIEPGFDADVLLLDADWSVKHTWCGGMRAEDIVR